MRDIIAMVMLALLALVVSCKNKCMDLEIPSGAVVLAQPYPMLYPSENPLPNKLIVELEAGNVCVVDVIDEKDFRVYKVRISDNKLGYIVHSQGMRFVDGEQRGRR